MTRSYSADSTATAAETWSLVSEPARWPEWAPHIRGAWGLGTPEVQAGQRGAARLLWVVPVPALVSAKSEHRSWSWQVGPVTLDHEVTPLPSGSRITMTISAPGPIEGVLAATYGPVVQLLVRRLARIAEELSR
ncbi:SRPBCC family protein [Antrihabitans cavernicola]|uniref:SRPBCC family protein n=1 Tax=Antrihabitans cavernicola TaxID=2495913 RepID=A0A5A7SHB3_9NOCA|nr:SRPBCC family protein [Spelaeibacter cavernicola]KAA0024107.1 SRPBCC family protein [Spelaeibacter cavernicola]